MRDPNIYAEWVKSGMADEAGPVPMRLSTTHLVALENVFDKTWVDIRKVSEPHRQRLIDLGMREPPLVQIEGDLISITQAGRDALAVHNT